LLQQGKLADVAALENKLRCAVTVRSKNLYNIPNSTKVILHMNVYFSERTRFWLVLTTVALISISGLIWLLDDWLSVHALSERQDHPNSSPVWLITSFGWSFFFNIWPIWLVGLLLGWLGASYFMPDVLDAIASDKAKNEILQQKAILTHDVTSAQMAQYIAEQAQLEAQHRAESAEETARLAKMSEYEANKALKAAQQQLTTLTEQLQQHMTERDLLAKQLSEIQISKVTTTRQPKPRKTTIVTPPEKTLTTIAKDEDNQLNLLG
jgi:hypothetical protein